jgi:hypothetical protein
MKEANSSKCMYVRSIADIRSYVKLTADAFNFKTKSCHKIITRANDDVDTIKRIIKSKKLEVLILESGKGYGSCDQLRMNQKTYWIAQNLASNGWKIDRLKYYKGKILKIILSPK